MNALVLNHLWQSTACAGGVAALAVVLRRYSARFRFWLWMAASLKFLVPFTLLAALGAAWRGEAAGQLAPPHALATVAQPFTAAVPDAHFSPLAAAPATHGGATIHWLVVLWLAGFVAVLAFWWIRWRRVARSLQDARPADGPLAALPLPVRLTDSGIEPGVFGILRPVLLLPADLPRRTTRENMQALIAHELCHARRRDNLWAALHTLVEAVFWFYPPVWWIGARLVAERERACDEAALAQCADPEAYAAGILQVYRHYTAAPSASVAGVAGGDLSRRIAAIINFGGIRDLPRASRWALAALLLSAVAAPLAGGRLFANQAAAPKPRFDAASIREWGPGPWPAGVTVTVGVHASPGRIYAQCANLNTLINYAYHLTGSERVEGMPGWANPSCYPDPRGAFTLEATEPAGTSEDQSRQMMQSLLADRFKLAVHWETRQMPIYALVIAPGGFKLKPSNPDNDPPVAPHSIGCPTEDPHCHMGLCCGSDTLAQIAASLTGDLGRPVIDKTGLTGTYYFGLWQWAGDDAMNSPLPSLPTLLRDKFGLEVKSEVGPVPVLVIDHVEKLSPN